MNKINKMSQLGWIAILLLLHWSDNTIEKYPLKHKDRIKVKDTRLHSKKGQSADCTSLNLFVA